jgi:hypothetical protein
MKKSDKYHSEEQPRIFVRLDKEVYETFKASCEANHRSQSAEIGFILRKHYELQP